jgi:hypothetical protein
VVIEGTPVSQTKSAKGLFRIGDRVLVPWNPPIVGRIVEDRGLLGRHGNRIYSVLVEFDPEDGENMVLELPAEDLEPAIDPEPVLDTAKIIDYFKRGGLIALLGTNRIGGRLRPNGWLRLNRRGDVVYSLEPGPGYRGGQTIPFHALYRGKHILEPFKDEVVSFLESFGLDRSQANDVISAVGTVS